MIGVAANSRDLQAAEEFFELFKTPWEPAVQGRRYRTLLSAGESIDNFEAESLIVYSSVEEAGDRETCTSVTRVSGPVRVEWGESTFPLYGHAVLFDVRLGTSVTTTSGKPLDYRLCSAGRPVHRVGYDLFQEVRHLLTEGQPALHALTPTLEMHIDLLRFLLTELRVTFAEIPPRPAGHEFICCLTHDVDFFGIRRHKSDRTLAGFMVRASLGTIVDVVRRRRGLTDAVRNLAAFVSLPLVFLKVLPDFWRPFEDYDRIEAGRRSTFFLVPFKGRPGLAPDGTVDARRAVKYDVTDIPQQVQRSAARGNEIALHGIDAWRDAEAGKVEVDQILSVTGTKSVGVRMHWLYFAEDSPRRLEAAGFDYDSTWGYNDAVGYRAGTGQVFRLQGTEELMELPLSIMDTALFYPARMGLSSVEALDCCHEILRNAKRFGGTVVINWHDRSVAPERLWGAFYKRLLTQIELGDRAWFGTAKQTVDWFRWRRSIRFSFDASSQLTAITSSVPCSDIPHAVVRTHRPVGEKETLIEEFSFDGRDAMTLNLES